MTTQQQKEKLMFEKKKIKDQADTIAEQTKRIVIKIFQMLLLWLQT